MDFRSTGKLVSGLHERLLRELDDTVSIVSRST